VDRAAPVAAEGEHAGDADRADRVKAVGIHL
jgi:hypothetical protein